jgi:hypothetical protein
VFNVVLPENFTEMLISEMTGNQLLFVVILGCLWAMAMMNALEFFIIILPQKIMKNFKKSKTEQKND